VVGADPGQDLAVRGRDGLDPEVFDPEVHEVHGDQHRGFDRGTHAHDGGTELLGAELAEGIDVRGVGLHDMRQDARPLLDEAAVAFDGQDLPALFDQLFCGGCTKTAQPDHQHGGIVGGAVDGA